MYCFYDLVNVVPVLYSFKCVVLIHKTKNREKIQTDLSTVILITVPNILEAIV